MVGYIANNGTNAVGLTSILDRGQSILTLSTLDCNMEVFSVRCKFVAISKFQKEQGHVYLSILTEIQSKTKERFQSPQLTGSDH